MNDHHEPDPTSEGDAHVETLLREVTAQDRSRTVPPDDVWQRIAAEVALDGATTSPRPNVHDEGDRSTADGADVVVLADRRWSRRAAGLVAVAAAAVLVAGGALVLTRGGGESTTVVASGRLGYDADSFDELGAGATASVSLVDDDGTLHLDIDDSVLPAPTGEEADLELWLIEADAEGNPVDLVSLGLVDPDAPDDGDFVVPPSYDPAVYSVVDISVEPRDGDPGHSGRSILRGSLVDV